MLFLLSVAYEHRTSRSTHAFSASWLDEDYMEIIHMMWCRAIAFSIEYESLVHSITHLTAATATVWQSYYCIYMYVRSASARVTLCIFVCMGVCVHASHMSFSDSHMLIMDFIYFSTDTATLNANNALQAALGLFLSLSLSHSLDLTLRLRCSHTLGTYHFD